MKLTSVKDQLLASLIANINAQRHYDMIVAQNWQDIAFLKAQEQIENVRHFINAPEQILGSHLTKHGEIAEQVEVALHNARQLLNQELPTATFDGVGRTAAEDYLVDGIAVQSKFINGLNSNLEHVLNHMEKYRYFGRDGSYYHIPKDQFELMQRIYAGEEVADLSSRTIQALQTKMARIEAQSGLSFPQVVRPGVSDYAEVQQGNIDATLDRHESELLTRHNQKQAEIIQEHQATFQEGIKVTATAAAVGGALSLGMSFYRQYRAGKNVFKGEFSAADWQKIGLNTVKGSVGGAVTGSAVYLLTNSYDLAAPFAAAYVTAAKGVLSLLKDLYHGELNFSEFQINALCLCADSAGVALAAVAGQTLIPIPVLGAVIGSLAGKFALSILLGSDQPLAAEMEASMTQLLQQLDATSQSVIAKINHQFEALGRLSTAAFDIAHNEQLVAASIELARAYQVDEAKILKNEADLERFLLGS